MSEVSFTISYKSAKMIISFIKFITENIRNNINMSGCYWKLSEIEDEMRKYKNKECDAVIELCRKMRTILYKNSEDIKKAMDAFINAVNEVVSDEVFNSI